MIWETRSAYFCLSNLSIPPSTQLLASVRKSFITFFQSWLTVLDFDCVSLVTSDWSYELIKYDV
jgi:hypothetical protein